MVNSFENVIHYFYKIKSEEKARYPTGGETVHQWTPVESSDHFEQDAGTGGRQAYA